MKELIRDKSPAELKGIIAKRLDEIGVQGVIRESFDVVEYEPQDTAAWDEAFNRFTNLPV